MALQLSYAQNMEDVHLEAIFGDLRNGTYIDIGGGHPVADNVSYSFYLSGWRGLVVEPQEHLATLYPHIRPRDTIESCLVGRSDGMLDFHVVETLHGFSTTVEANAKGAQQFGAGYRTERRPVATLTTLAQRHGLTRIDFLKVDVEGAELDVLAGNDWRRVRPRVVVVEAVAPGSMAETHVGWEHVLSSNDYRFVFFDGLNRFYVAAEAHDLAARVPREKAAWDSVRHLYEFGRAPDVAAHPDHALARALLEGFLADLPRRSPRELAGMLARSEAFKKAEADGAAAVTALLAGTAEYVGRDDSAAGSELTARLATDRVRAALGRIAATYDGGQLLD
jgi:FkbM family methyltransferase